MFWEIATHYPSLVLLRRSLCLNYNVSVFRSRNNIQLKSTVDCNFKAVNECLFYKMSLFFSESLSLLKVAECQICILRKKEKMLI